MNFTGKAKFGSIGAPDGPLRIGTEWRFIGGEFAMSGSIDTRNGTRWVCSTAGQCLGDISKHLAGDPLFDSMFRVWSIWHLNHMRAGCKHQRADG